MKKTTEEIGEMLNEKIFEVFGISPFDKNGMIEVLKAFEEDIRADERKAPANEQTLVRLIQLLIDRAHATSKSKGWHDKPVDDGTCIALMHSELSECLEGMRKGGPMEYGWPIDEHCPDFSNPTIELADCIIRILDFAGKKNLLLAEGLLAKMDFNETREHKHGGKNF